MKSAGSILRTNSMRPTSSSTTKGNQNYASLIERVTIFIQTQENKLKQLNNQDIEEIIKKYNNLSPDDQKKFNNAFDDNINTFKQSGTLNIDIAEQIKNKIKNSLKAEPKFHNNQTMNTGSKRESYNECLPLHGTKPRVFEKALSKEFSRQKSNGGSHQKYIVPNERSFINPTHKGKDVKPYLVNMFNKRWQQQEDFNTQGELTSLPERDETDAKEMMPQEQKLQQLKNHFGRGLLPPLKLLKDEDGNSLQYKDINALFEEINAQFDEKIPKHYKDIVSALLINNFELARERIINDAKNSANNSANNYNLVYIMIHKANSQESLIADKNLIEKLTELINDDNIDLSSKIELIISYINKFNLGEQRELVNHIVDYFICNTNVTENIKHNSELISCLFKLIDFNYDKDNQIINLVKVVADSGNLTAILKLAYYYLLGDHRIQNHDLGIQYLKKAVDMGNTRASCNLGEYLINSKNKEEVAEGIQYLKNAIEGGEKFAMYILGNYLINSENKKKVTEGIQHLKNAINLGNTSAMCILGNYLIKSKNKKEVAEGIQYLKNAIKVDDTSAMCVLGDYLINSENKKEWEEGIQYLKNAIEAGDTSAMYILNDYLIINVNNEEKKVQESIITVLQILKQLAKNGNGNVNVTAMSHLGMYYEILLKINLSDLSDLVKIANETTININGSLASRKISKQQQLQQCEDRIKKLETLNNEIRENSELVVKYFKTAANLGDVNSIKLLCRFYESGDEAEGGAQPKKAAALRSIAKKISDPNATFTAQEVNTVIAYYQETKSQQIFGWLGYAVENNLNLSPAENSAQKLHDMINSQESKYTHNDLV